MFTSLFCTFGEPPGIKLGPFSAPSSPPDTPVPTKRKPLLSSSFTLRVVSGKWLFPPSMTMSPASKNGMRPWMTESTGFPA